MSRTHIYNNSITSRAIVLLDTYFGQLSNDIEQNGYCTEFLGQAEGYFSTRLLCQSRCMYFLTEYSLARKDKKALSQAVDLYKLIKNDYTDADDNWLQYPGKQILDNLYEYSFLIFSIAKLYAVTRHRAYMDDLIKLDHIVRKYYIKPQDHFSNLKDDSGYVSQNALMHLYESYLEFYKATNDDNYAQLLVTLLTSMKTMFYDKSVDLVSEYYPIDDENNIYEPGHTFEWGCLLAETRQYSQNIVYGVNVDNMIRSAESYGVTDKGLVKQSISNLNDKDRYRIWPMLERMRFYLITDNADMVNSLYWDFDNFFINPQTKLPVEYINAVLKPDFEGVKTTTSYHLINCLKHFI